MVSPVLRGISCADYRATLTQLEGAGWSISKTNGGHLKFEHPKASKAIFGPCSPSDHRSRHNVIRKCNIAIEEGSRAEKVFGPAPKQAELSEREFTSILKSSKRMRKTNRHKHVPTPNHFLSEGVSENAASTPKRKLGTLALPATKHQSRAVSEIATSPMQAVAKKLNITSAANQKPPIPKAKASPTLPAKSYKDNKTMLATVPSTPTLSPTPAPTQPVAPTHMPVPATPPVSRKPDPLKADAAAIPKISADILALAMKIASGEMKQVEITADMLGQTLYFDGQIALSGAGVVKAATTPAAPKLVPAAAPMGKTATATLTQNAAIEATVIDAL
jgi:predicted RNA binding protein YcfA (HicA-like mRNA interferase family)